MTPVRARSLPAEILRAAAIVALLSLGLAACTVARVAGDVVEGGVNAAGTVAETAVDVATPDGDDDDD